MPLIIWHKLARVGAKMGGYIDDSEGYQPIDKRTTWWKRPLVAIGAMVVWFFGLIVVGGLGYPSQYFLASECAAAIGFAAAPFWRFRASRWFWPSVVLLMVAHLLAMYLLRAQVGVTRLPSKPAVQGLFLADCVACWLVIVGIAYQSEGKFPWKDGQDS